MNPNLKSAKRILILGDAGRGKSTLAQKLSVKLNIPSFSTDDFFYKTKFSEKQDKQKSIAAINKVYSKSEWIVEGTTRHLIEPAFKKADLLVYLNFRKLLSQWWTLIKRHRIKKNEKISDLLRLLRHVFYKRFGLGYKRGEPKLLQLLQPYKDKLIILHSHDEINKFTIE